MGKLVHISKTKYRVLVSDILPYELPIFYTNRFFARFLEYYGVHTENGELKATKHSSLPALNEFLQLLGGSCGSQRPAFQYQILRGEIDPNEKRTLTIIHPYHQVQMLEFYDKFKY